MPALITWWTLDCRLLSPLASAEEVHRVGVDLLARWTAPVRQYHTTQHLVEMIWALEELERAGAAISGVADAEATDARSSAVARVAAWFHDAVYDPSAAAGANESQSSALARTTLAQLGVGDDDLGVVTRLVDLTVDHAATAPTALETAFQDADLWILSADRSRFDDYCVQVRTEYAHVEEQTYRTGRSAILFPLLDRPSVYGSAHARSEWEGRARMNLRRELSRLA